jgi:hypothetical protein
MKRDLEKEIELMSDDRLDAVSDSAIAHWTFRLETWLLVVALIVLCFAIFFGLSKIVHALWPGSMLAPIVVTVGYCGFLVIMLRGITSLAVSEWRFRRALRRELDRLESRRAP